MIQNIRSHVGTQNYQLSCLVSELLHLNQGHRRARSCQLPALCRTVLSYLYSPVRCRYHTNNYEALPSPCTERVQCIIVLILK